MIATAVKLGARNLARHRRRTLLLGLSIALGAAAVVVNRGWIAGIQDRLIDHLLVSQVGHLRVVPRAGNDTRFGGGSVMADPAGVETIARRAVPGAETVFGLATMGMLLGAEAASSRVAIWGIEPRDRRQLATIRERAVGPTEDLAPGAVFLSRKLADRIGARPGGEVTLTLPNLAGDFDAGLLRVAGVIERGAPWQDYFVYVALADVQRLMAAGDGVNEVKLFLPEGERQMEPARAALAAALAEARPELEVQTYRQSGSFFFGIVTANRFFLGLIDLTLLAAIGLGVSSAQLLSVSERQSEIGAMRALGTARRMIYAVFLAEGLALAIVFGLAGALAGSLAVWAAAGPGIRLPVEAFEWAIGGQRLHPRWDPAAVGQALAMLAAAVALAGLVPARRAARLDPVRALREGQP